MLNKIILVAVVLALMITVFVYTTGNDHTGQNQLQEPEEEPTQDMTDEREETTSINEANTEGEDNNLPGELNDNDVPDLPEALEDDDNGPTLPGPEDNGPTLPGPVENGPTLPGADDN